MKRKAINFNVDLWFRKKCKKVFLVTYVTRTNGDEVLSLKKSIRFSLKKQFVSLNYKSPRPTEVRNAQQILRAEFKSSNCKNTHVFNTRRCWTDLQVLSISVVLLYYFTDNCHWESMEGTRSWRIRCSCYRTGLYWAHVNSLFEWNFQFF